MSNNQLNKEKQVSLVNLTDYQKGILAEMSYIDLTLAGKVRLYEDKGIPFSELSEYMLWPTEPACRGILNGKQFEEMSHGVIGPVLGSDVDLCKQAVEAGLQDLQLTDWTTDQKTGFFAITFKDRDGNTGISYRGTDFDYANGCLKDWINANLGGHLMGDSKQGYQANLYFMQQCDPEGNNYLYGHSLGGNLAQQVLADHHQIIKETFTINGTPISPSKLNTKELINVFNSKKLNCCLIAGDVVGLTKDVSAYKNNIRMIENCNGLTTRFSLAHGLCSASYNEDKSFKTIDYDETLKLFKSKCEASDFRFFGKNGWEVLKTIQDAEGWLSGKRPTPPELLKDAVIKQTIIDKKVPVTLDVNGKPSHIFGIISNAWHWTTKTAATIMRPIDHTIKKTSSMALASAIDCFRCPEKVSTHLAIWTQEIKNFNFGDWVADVSSKFGITPQRLDGNKIKCKQDFDNWKKDILESMKESTPDWIRNDLLNCKIALAVLKEDKTKDLDTLFHSDKYIDSVQKTEQYIIQNQKDNKCKKTLESIYRQSQSTKQMIDNNDDVKLERT